MVNEKEWNKILQNDEYLIWHGTPYKGLVLGIEMVAVAVFSLLVFAFCLALAWALSSQSDMFWPVTISGALIVISISLAWPIYDMQTRKKPTMHLLISGRYKVDLL